MIRTCVISSGSDTVTIGWANVAQNANFHAWLRQRMWLGYKYIITADSIARNVIYNNAVKINFGVGSAELDMATRELGGFIASGDISIVRLLNPRRTFLRMAKDALDVLEHDAIEVPPFAKTN